MHKKNILSFILTCLILFFPNICLPQKISLENVPQIMELLMDYHIEHKNLAPKVLRRCFSVYVNQLDPEKIYLLKKDVHSFYSLSDAAAKKIIERVQIGDFSDFLSLRNSMQKAVSRARKIRENLKDSFALSNKGFSCPKKRYTEFALGKEELIQRQKNFLSCFLSLETKQISNERKQQIFSFYENKMTKKEDIVFSQDQHVISLQILKAFAKSLDAHSSFFSEEEAADMRMNLEKEFEGIGVVLTEKIDGVVIIDIIKNSPAEECEQIQVGDILLKIDNESVKNLSFEDVLKKMKNNKKKIILSLGRKEKDSMKQFDIELKRRPISMEEEKLTYDFESFGDGIIGKITLHSFYENSSGVTSEKDLKKAISRLQTQGKLRGLVLDLRENAGGFLSQAIKVAGIFLSNGVVVMSKYSNDEMKYFRNLQKKARYRGPLIVLTSKLSASAAEIVAQALQDYGVALIVGDGRTFGKGSIQYQTVTNDQADLYFKVTVGKYYTVSGKSTQIEGVKSDIIVPTIYYPYRIGERFLEYPISSDKIPSAYKDDLKDLDFKTKFWCEFNYLPHLQRVTSFWKNMSPQLKKNSQHRLKIDPNMSLFIKRQKIIQRKIEGEKISEPMPSKNYGIEDLQMIEAVNILKDMMLIEIQTRN